MPAMAAAAVIGAQMLSSQMQADAAGKASGIQSDSAMMGLQAQQQGRAAATAQMRESQAEMQRQLLAYRELMNPYIGGGEKAQNQKLRLLGLGGGAGATAGFTPKTEAQLRAEMIGQFTSAGTPGQTQKMAQFVPSARVGEDAWANPVQDQISYFDMGGATGGTVDEAGLNNAVNNAFNAQGAATAGYAGMTDEEAQAQEIAKFENSPYFRAITRQSEDAMLQNASATGGLRGGNMQDALSKNRPILLQSLIDKQLNNLSGLTSSGQMAATSLGNAGMMTGQAGLAAGGQMAGQLMQGGMNEAAAYGQSGAAQAGGVLAQSNANVNMLGNIAGMFGGKMAGGSNPFGGGTQAAPSGGFSGQGFKI